MKASLLLKGQHGREDLVVDNGEVGCFNELRASK